MKLQSHYQRAIVATLLAALTLSAVAPAAWAGQGRGRWQKHRRGGVVVQRVTMSHRSDSFGPAIAGFIGGLALGAVLNNAGSSSAQACEGPRGQSRADFYYWDPYCHERYSSLDAYGSHLRHGCGHPRRRQGHLALERRLHALDALPRRQLARLRPWRPRRTGTTVTTATTVTIVTTVTGATAATTGRTTTSTTVATTAATTGGKDV